MSSTHKLAVFGASDGLVACLGVVLACAARGQGAVIHAAVGLLLAEGLGMAASEWLSQDTTTSLREAAVMGASTALPIVLVALPWLLLSSVGGVVGSSAIAALCAACVAAERRRGARGWAETFGVLTAVAALAYVAGAL